MKSLIKILSGKAGVRSVPLWSFLVILCAGFSVYYFVLKSGPVITRTTGWERPLVLVSSGREIVHYNIASVGRFSILVYEEKQPRGAAIKAVVSFDRGENHIPDIKIAEIESSIEARPVAAVSNEGSISVVWQQFNEETAATELYQSDSSDFGANWTAPEVITPDSSPGFVMMMIPDIHYDERGDLHLFFHGLVRSGINLYHSIRREGRGYGSASPLMRLPEGLRGAFFPVFSFDKSNVVIVWQSKTGDYNDSLFYISSSNYGRSWSRAKRITPDSHSEISPFLLTHNGISYLLYSSNENNNWSVNLLQGDAVSGVWDEKPLLISDTISDSLRPHAVIHKDELIVSWFDQREGAPHVFLRKYSINEKTLSPVSRISEARQSRDPRLLAFDDRVVVFWKENLRILSRKSDIYAVPPVVVSSTHPEGRWSRQPRAVVEWRQPSDPSGIVGYAVMYNTSPYYHPTVQVLQGSVARYVVPQLEEGVSYFHIRSIDGAGNMSRTVHYKIKSSINPMPMPLVVSPTHPEGKAVDSADPLLRWAVDQTGRLKGFFIGVSRDRVVAPRDFTTDFELGLEGLQPGNYYFTVRAVDMTNTPGPANIYHFIVGGDTAVDEEYLGTLSPDIDDIVEPAPPRRPGRPRLIPASAPGVAVTVEGEVDGVINKSSFRAVVSPIGLKPVNIEGYSVVLSPGRVEPLGRINYKNNILRFDNIPDGDYYISIKAGYRVRGREQWTGTVQHAVKVVSGGFENPVFELRAVIVEKISGNPLFVTVSVSAMAVLVLINGFGSRMLYSLRRVTYLFRREV